MPEMLAKVRKENPVLVACVDGCTESCTVKRYEAKVPISFKLTVENCVFAGNHHSISNKQPGFRSVL